MRLSACDFGDVTRVQWLQMWQTWAVLVAALFMNWFSLRLARFSWSATMRLFSNSEMPAKQVRRHENLACAAVYQVVRSMLHRLRLDFRIENCTGTGIAGSPRGPRGTRGYGDKVHGLGWG